MTNACVDQQIKIVLDQVNNRKCILGWCRRYWQEVIRGIDWFENSTWISEVPISAENHDVTHIWLYMQSQKKRNIARRLSFSSSMMPYSELDSKTMIQRIDLDSMRMSSLRKFFPMKLKFSPRACRFGDKGIQELVVIGKCEDNRRNASDTIRKVTSKSQGSYLGLPLWHPSIEDRQLFAVVADETCFPTTRYEI